MSKKIILTKKGESAVCGFHPWIFKGDIEQIEGDPQPGDIVEVWGLQKNRWLAWAFFESTSNLSAKIFSWVQAESFSANWLSQKLSDCLSLRQTLGLKLENSFRLVHGEGDQLPSLIVDWFSGLCSVQITGSGMWQQREVVLHALSELLSPQALTLQTETKDSQNTFLPPHHVELITGNIPDSGWPYHQNNLTWITNPLTFQKTGAYLDQRINHQIISKLAIGKRVWDLYCFTGGFSFCAAQQKAKHVLGVDRSEKTIQVANSMKESLSLANLEFKQSEIKDFFESAQTLEKPDLIVLDPPKLVTSHKTKDAGLRHYFRINELALSHLNRGGILATFSCSGRVSLQEWTTLVTSVLRRNKRQAKIIHILGAAPDHPTNPHLTDSQYLKGIVLQIT